MAFLKFSRDKRGYEYYALVQPVVGRRGKSRTRLLYWFRTPPNVKVGREPFDEEMRRVIEAQNPRVDFDWERINNTPIPPPQIDWRERRRAQRARARAEMEEAEAEAAVSEESASSEQLETRDGEGRPDEEDTAGFLDAGETGPSADAGSDALEDTDDTGPGESSDGPEGRDRTPVGVESGPAVSDGEGLPPGPAIGQDARARGRRRRRRGSRGRRPPHPGSAPEASASPSPSSIEDGGEASGPQPPLFDTGAPDDDDSK